MHEVLDAIALLFDTLLTPFVQGGEPHRSWIKIAGGLIAVVGILCFLGFILWAYFATIESLT